MATAADGFRSLDETSLVEYIEATPALRAQLGNQLDGLTIKEVGDGNLNFVYIVVGAIGSFVVKQLYKISNVTPKIDPKIEVFHFLMCWALGYMMTPHDTSVAEYCGNMELCRHTEKVVFSDPYMVSQYNHWTSPYLDRDSEAVREDNTLKIEVAELKSKFSERAQALIHGDLHTGSVMVTSDSTQVIDPEFAFYGPMGFDIGAFLGNLILAFFAQDGHADQGNDRQAYKRWILKMIGETWNLFQKKFISLWDEHKDGNGEAYPVSIYNSSELLLLVQKRYMANLFHDSLGFGAAKMIRRIVGVVHVEDFESIADASKRACCERRALNFAKMLLKERHRFQTINQVILAIQEIQA